MSNLIELAGRGARLPIGRRSGGARLLHSLLDGLGRGFDAALDCADRYRQRRALAAMPDHLLKDIGMSQADVERELSKPFWKC